MFSVEAQLKQTPFLGIKAPSVLSDIQSAPVKLPRLEAAARFVDRRTDFIKCTCAERDKNR